MARVLVRNLGVPFAGEGDHNLFMSMREGSHSRASPELKSEDRCSAHVSEKLTSDRRVRIGGEDGRPRPSRVPRSALATKQPAAGAAMPALEPYALGWCARLLLINLAGSFPVTAHGSLR